VIFELLRVQNRIFALTAEIAIDPKRYISRISKAASAKS
jgi:hypothetical protein